MARKRTAHGHGPGARTNGISSESREGRGDGSRRVTGEPQGGGGSQEGPPSPAVQRAEELVDRMAEGIGHYADLVGQNLLWLAARAREEAEDIWAEAQELRRRKGSESSGTSAGGSA